MRQRIIELDILRGIAIILMVAFHFIFDLSNFFGFAIEYHRGFWHYEGRLSAILFIMAVGLVSAVIANGRDFKEIWQKNLQRGIRLIALGLLITVVTWFFDKNWTIWFGILHFLGVSIILSTLFVRFRWLNLILGILAIGLGSLLLKSRADHFWFLIFGIQPYGFKSLDYYSLLPWFGVVLIGLGLGNMVYSQPVLNARRLAPRPLRPLLWLGKYSLWIYLIHQPILLGILRVLF